MSSGNKNPAIQLAIEVLKEAAANGHRSQVLADLKKAGLETTRPSDHIGHYAKYPGHTVIYMGTWEANPGQIVHTGFDTDFLKTIRDEQLFITFKQAGDELAKLNGGWRYGNGSVTAVRKAIKDGRYKDGDAVLAPLEFLNGRRDSSEDVVRAANLSWLLKSGKPAVQEIADNIATRNRLRSRPYVLSGDADSKSVSRVQLMDGSDRLIPKGTGRAAIVPFRIFRSEPEFGGLALNG